MYNVHSVKSQIVLESCYFAKVCGHEFTRKHIGANFETLEERACCFAWFVFLVSHVGCVALPRGAMGLSAVCDCGIS